VQRNVRIHPTAEVSPRARIGEGTSIWHQAQVREDAEIGHNCTIAKGVYIDAGVHLGNNVKVQNYVSIYHGVVIEDGVFVGPHVCFTNDRFPRAVNPDGSLKGAEDWEISRTLVRAGAALGANATIVAGITVGLWAMVGCGSVVTRDVPDYGLVWGNPARLHGFVCPCGNRLPREPHPARPPYTDIEASHGTSIDITLACPQCGRQTVISSPIWRRVSELP
jgi:UDP-2-acetamido-3-amino-2,3-dideoxy-glucuronate N-acetyltransferase